MKNFNIELGLEMIRLLGLMEEANTIIKTTHDLNVYKAMPNLSNVMSQNMSSYNQVIIDKSNEIMPKLIEIDTKIKKYYNNFGCNELK